MEKNNNNFGVLRLFFASLVILSHSPELVDGNRSREILTQLFHVFSFGELAVDSFFLISGYLIMKSYSNTASLSSYLMKRILRIYPAYIVASLIAIFVFASISCGNLGCFSNASAIANLVTLIRLFVLDTPFAHGVFLDNHYRLLNGAAWTIKYEFLCYLCVPIFFLLGFVKKRYLYALFTTSVIVSFWLFVQPLAAFNLPWPIAINLAEFTRLMSAFLIGGCYFVFQDKLVWRNAHTLACIFFLLLFMLTNRILAEIGFIIFGSYLLFNFAFHFKSKLVGSIGTKNDISYGVYLYAWPFQSLTIQYFPSINPWILCLFTLTFTFIAGYISWAYVEKPFMEMKTRYA